MKYTAFLASLFVALSSAVPDGRAQVVDEAISERVSAKTAFALSMLVPGLGHRYARGGDWDGWASVFAVADGALWVGLVGAEWRRDHLIESYRTLAAKHAAVDLEGKGRDFYLNVAAYPSSEAYTDAQLRNRNWTRLDYAADPSFKWDWDTQANYLLFRELRQDSETLGRRRSLFLTALAANRLIAGISALRAASRTGEPDMRLSVDVPPAGASAPLLRMNYTF